VDLKVQFLFSSFSLGIEFEQYLPLAVKKRTSTEGSSVQTTDFGKNSFSSTDGGRRIILSVLWN